MKGLLQLENLKVILEDAVKNSKAVIEQAKIIKQIVEIKYLIEQRNEFLRRSQSSN